MAIVKMKAKYKGYCLKCKRDFKAGTPIDYNTDTKKATHQVCPKKKGKPRNAGVLLPGRAARFVTGR